MDIQTAAAISAALSKITGRARSLQRLINYYDGEHELVFATDKYKNTFGAMLKTMRENLCPIVVDAPADRMEIINFAGSDAAKEIAGAAWAIWQNNKMELVSNDLHREAFKTGYAYLIVDEIDGEAKFFLQDSRQCAIILGESNAAPLFGAKLWPLTDKRVRLNLYFADRTLKFITSKSCTGGDALKAVSFEPFQSDTETAETPNPFGVIPLFEFKTEPILTNAIPIQDRLNKTICDELVAQEFSAYRQRYATGLEMPENEITGAKEMPFKAGADRLWHTDSKETQFGEFGATDLSQFLKVEDSARLSIARVTGTPLHYFSFTTSNDLSGEALKTLESRFTKRIKRTSINFGVVWAAAIKFALGLEGRPTLGALTTQFDAPEQRSESELLDNLGKKKDILAVPVDTLREEFGYSVEDVAKFNAAAPPPLPPVVPGQMPPKAAGM